MSILSLKNVSYGYEGAPKEAIREINIDFKKGRLYVMMGKSGSGKTTLLSLIAGFDYPTKGRIFYKENDLQKVERDEYRAKHIGVIFQGYNLLTNATAIENLELAMEISQVKIKDKKKVAYELLENVGINQEMANRKILKLSGGEQQRIAIARALICDPDIIIADEPTGNLDVETEENIMNILAKMAHEENKCVIVVTHSRDVATFADEIWGLNNGKLTFVR